MTDCAMKLRKYSEQQLRGAIKSSTSIRQVLQKLNVAPLGGNYDIFRKAIKHFRIDTSHFNGQGWSKGKQLGRRRETKTYLNGYLPISSYKLKRRLLDDGILERQCSRCSCDTWLNQPIPLELDHINGNSKNNRLENLRLLCPNCHALTSTYRGKNRSKA